MKSIKKSISFRKMKTTRFFSHIVLMFTLFSLGSAISLAAAQNVSQPDSTTIMITAFGETKVLPNAYTIFLNIKVQNATLYSAQTQAQNTYELFLFNLKNAGVAEDKVKLINIFSRELKDYDQKTKSWKRSGFEVQQSLQISDTSLSSLGLLTSVISRTDNVFIEHVRFFNTNVEAIKNYLYTHTVSQLRHRAELVAKTLGKKLNRIISINIDDYEQNLSTLSEAKVYSLSGSQNPRFFPKPIFYRIKLTLTAQIGGP